MLPPAPAAADQLPGSTFWLVQPACATQPMLLLADVPANPSAAAAALLRVPQRPAWDGPALALLHPKLWNHLLARQPFRSVLFGLKAPQVSRKSPSRSVCLSHRRKSATGPIDRSVPPPRP